MTDDEIWSIAAKSKSPLGFARNIEAPLATPIAGAGAEPCGFLFQHDETGRTTFVESDGAGFWSEMNPRWHRVGPLYLAPPAAQDAAIRDAALELAAAICGLEFETLKRFGIGSAMGTATASTCADKIRALKSEHGQGERGL